MKRPFAVTILALLHWLEATSIVLVGLLLYLWVQLGAEIDSAALDLPAEAEEALTLLREAAASGAMAPVYLVLGVMAALFVAVGVGLWRLRNWARRVTIVLMVLRLLLLLPGFVAGLLRQDLVSLGVQLLFGVVYAWIVWYLRQPQVKQLFGAVGRRSSQSLPPE